MRSNILEYLVFIGRAQYNISTDSESPNMEYICTVRDSREGRFDIHVKADTEWQAEEEAQIAAAERGCRDVVEIELEPLE